MTAPRRIEIVGGGLAGLSLGLALRRAGVPVTVHEAGGYPRHRVCGEFIAGLDRRTLRRLGLERVLAGALVLEQVAWHLGEGPPRRQRLPAPALGVSRHLLDARLAAAFVAAGGELHEQSRVTDDHDAPGRVFATGRRRATRSPWIGLKFHARELPLERDLEMHLGAHSYVGLSRVDAHTVNVCGLFRRRALCARGAQLLLGYCAAAGLGRLAQRLARAAIDAESFCAVAALDFDRRPPALPRLSIGDAAATIPPFTGNGMTMAFQSAELALDPLLAFARHQLAWPEARRAVHAALRDRFRLRLGSAHLLHPFLLHPKSQRWFARLSRAHLVPFRPLYASLH